MTPPKPTPAKGKYKNGYLDGSGQGTVTLNEKSVLRTHWGCSCCDSGPTQKDIELAEEICRKLNSITPIVKRRRKT